MAKMQVRQMWNKPTLTMNGQTIAPMLYGLSDFPAAASFTAQAQRNIAAFRQAGIRLVNVDTALRQGWFKKDPFDPEPMLAEIANALEAAPDAKVLVRLHLNPPYWWHRDHPEECVIYRTKDGDTIGKDNGEQDRLISHDADGFVRVSLASERWMAEAGERLAILCEALKEAPEGESLMGIQVACGIYGEWHQWGTDVSPVMQKRFRRFLRDTYETDEALQQAWRDPAVTIDTAPFHPEIFTEPDEGMFRDPAKSRYIMDAQTCHQTTVCDAILYFCQIVKTHLPDALAGAFYGYYWGTNGNNATIGGHLQPDRLYASEWVDFLCGPFCYMENRKADGVPMQRGMLESSRLRGMLWLTEMDQHPEGAEANGRGDPAQMDQTIAVLRRNVLQVLCAGQGLWYYDHRVVPQFRPGARAGGIYRKRGWWEEPELMAEIGALRALAEEIANRPYEPAADVLLVSDTDSYYCRGRVADYEYRIHESVARCGVSYDCIYLQELPVADLRRYKCVIFTNAYRMTPEMRDACRMLLKDTAAVWLYAEGYCDGETLSIENLSRTVGMEMTKTQGQTSVNVLGGQLLPGLTQQPEEIAIPREFAPLFAVSDGEAIPMARYENGEVAAAVKGCDIWLPGPYLTRSWMQAIIKHCGAHVYCEAGDPVIAGAGLVAINCPHGGTRTLRLRNGKTVALTLDGPATAALDAETGERLL